VSFIAGMAVTRTPRSVALTPTHDLLSTIGTIATHDDRYPDQRLIWLRRRCSSSNAPAAGLHSTVAVWLPTDVVHRRTTSVAFMVVVAIENLALESHAPGHQSRPCPR